VRGALVEAATVPLESAGLYFQQLVKAG
jgi:hypothetical protein